jgi:catechol 2,3-dioxygenase-like lactoylglutathione lyase family enzyme
MEQLITNLVADFESGRMSRRDLIRSLTIAVTAACGSAGNASAQGNGFRALGVGHISYEVADYSRTRDFYAGLLGMKVSNDTGKECVLSFGDVQLLPRKRTGRASRVDHIAYTISDWDRNRVQTQLKRRGLRPEADNAAGEESFHIVDPDGFDVQITSGPLSQNRSR